MPEPSQSATARQTVNSQESNDLNGTNIAGGGNRKKAKRRAKAAARQAVDQVTDQGGVTKEVKDVLNQNTASRAIYEKNIELDRITHFDPVDRYEYSSGDEDDRLAYEAHYRTNNDALYHPDDRSPSSMNTSRKRTKRTHHHALPPDLPFGGDPTAMITSAVSHFSLTAPLPPPHLRSSNRMLRQDRIWNTSTFEERERIKEFWLSLSENDRKGLLKVEKTAVLNKMKEQQKHSCSCTVCGRKRSAIEEELEVLYDAYYEELAHYASHQHTSPGQAILPPLAPRKPIQQPQQRPDPPPRASTQPPTQSNHRTSRVHEIMDEQEQDLQYDEDSDSDLPYSDEEEDYEDTLPQRMGSGFFEFGNNLTVKDGILTVADDLLKNDGKRFIEMMEQLAERRMRREGDVEYAAQQPTPVEHHNDRPLEDEEVYDDEGDYDSQEDYEEEEEDEMGGITEEQRMEEGRRMFQIFAARMFEQRVLTAYREKVASDRQARLLQELEEEDKASAQKDAKKVKDAEKKKNKKAVAKQMKAAKDAKKEAEKLAEELAAREAADRKLEEQRIRKEEAKKKREAEKSAQEQEKAKKEQAKSQQKLDAQKKQAEQEQKARDAKLEKQRVKDEESKKKRDEQEVKDIAATQNSKVVEEQTQEAYKSNPVLSPPEALKRPSQPIFPPGLANTKPASPSVAIATPVLPKANTAVTLNGRARQMSEHGAPTISPTVNSPLLAVQKRQSPPSNNQRSLPIMPSNPQRSVHVHQLQQPIIPTMMQQQHHMPLQAAPGMIPPFQSEFGQSLFNGNNIPLPYERQPMPPFPPQHQTSLPSADHFRAPFSAASPITGLASINARVNDVPPGFQALQQHVGLPLQPPGLSRNRAPTNHNRQPSIDEINPLQSESSLLPIAKPTPIQRPTSVNPNQDILVSKSKVDIDESNKHLGSSALLDDADDEPMFPMAALRRTSNPVGNFRSGSMPFGGSSLYPTGKLVQPRLDNFGSVSGSWSSTSAFGPSPVTMTNNNHWGTSLTSNSPSTTSAWSSNPFPPSMRQGNNANRARSVRLAMCKACRILTSNSTTGNEFHDVALILQQIDRSQSLDVLPQLDEIQDICETEGDAYNGGGLLHLRKSGQNFAIKFETDNNFIDHNTTPQLGRMMPNMSGLGDIGSLPPNYIPGVGNTGSRSTSGGNGNGNGVGNAFGAIGPSISPPGLLGHHNTNGNHQGGLGF